MMGYGFSYTEIRQMPISLLQRYVKLLVKMEEQAKRAARKEQSL